MGHDSEPRPAPLEARRTEWIETFRSRTRYDLRPGWRRCGSSEQDRFIEETWCLQHRPDWAERGLLAGPRGRQWLRLEQRLHGPKGGGMGRGVFGLCLSWWAEAARVWLDGVLVHEGDLFDTACRLPLPERCRAGAELSCSWSCAVRCTMTAP